MFTPMRVADVRRETDECVSIALEPPTGFTYVPGQYLTFRTNLDGAEVRRSYSICSAPGDPELRVAVKQVPGGAFSSYIASAVHPGDVLEVYGPEGRFTPLPDPKPHRHVVGFAAGSGITPVLGIVRHVLATEPTARVTVVYGNRSVASVVFREQLAGLKDSYLDRLRVVHVLSREGTDIPLHSGRIDAPKVRQLLATVLDAADVDEVFICGPQEMSVTVRGALLEAGIDAHRVHVELFGTVTAPPPPPPDPTAGAVRAKVVLHGRTSEVEVAPGETVLDAGRRAGLELPWSCAAGVCATCRAKVVGPVDMAVNHSLEPWEVDAGYRLTCQSRARADDLVVDYDA
ncbi:MAG: 2Fe-2S iron-sulfur cluster binding domain-containing protein [Actinobacteria bacterium]|nr:2Fe-2S iron-sulfur cluster binding domain-containing protein [Actinomycetota bacterium]MCA1721133.1 2Fe-2S iron-sulfur cluster binding domain-containing protein [Actinomycetota bacterium]